MTDVTVVVGGGLKDDAAAFVNAWRRAELGDTVAERVLAFESWEALSALMTGARFRLLRHLHGHPEPSVAALARALKRQYRRVHDDVSALADAGLVDRSASGVRTTAGLIKTEMRF